MQVIKFFIVLSLLVSHAFAYECKTKELNTEFKGDKKAQLAELKKASREDLFQGLLFEITKKDLPVKPGKARIVSNYLVSTEPNEDKRAFIKLLKVSSDLETTAPRTLELKEICELNAKVNSLPKAN